MTVKTTGAGMRSWLNEFGEKKPMDIIERLREVEDVFDRGESVRRYNVDDLVSEAANEIERLRGEVDALNEENERIAHHAAEVSNENKELRQQVAELQQERDELLSENRNLTRQVGEWKQAYELKLKENGDNIRKLEALARTAKEEV